MRALAGHAADYLTLRRALGVKLIRQGQELTQLVAFCDAAGASTLTTELAIAWARLPQGVAPTLGEPAGHRARVRPLSDSLRSGDRGPATERLPSHPAPPRPLPVH
jgi:hypothetical protein